MARNLVLCCDGTANKFGDVNTSVVRVVEVLAPGQRLFYDPGVGTMPGDSWRHKIKTVFDLALATTLGRNIEDAYIWLMKNWEPEDRIYIFGFSRGAYTARVIAAMLHHIGLLPRDSENLVSYARRLVLSARKRVESLQLGDRFRRTFARPTANDQRVEVQFLGIFDTVSSVGWVWDPVKYRFSATNPSILSIRHAIAIDERRGFYRQNVMRPPEPRRGQRPQDLQQMWFTGVHSDIGGGYPNSQLWWHAFDWIITGAKDAGLDVDATRRATIAPRPPANWTQEPPHRSLKGLWWLAELFPKLVWKEQPDGRFTPHPRLNLGRHRKIFDGEVIHRSALEYIRANVDYAPANLSLDFLTHVRGLPVVKTDVPYKEVSS